MNSGSVVYRHFVQAEGTIGRAICVLWSISWCKIIMCAQCVFDYVLETSLGVRVCFPRATSGCTWGCMEEEAQSAGLRKEFYFIIIALLSA